MVRTMPDVTQAPLAPLGLFVYKRPEHTARTIAALKACTGFAETPVTVFSDGPKSPADVEQVAAVRALVSRELPKAKLVAAPENRGLAASIICGVDHLVGEQGRAIILEDDLVVTADFLTYMNTALDRYSDTPEVMQISGHMFGADVGQHAVFLPFTTSWGWATWTRAWRAFDAGAAGSEALETDAVMRQRFDLNGAYRYSEMLAMQKAGAIDSWAIRWYWSVFRKGGLTLYPPRTLVSNTGFGDGATNTRRFSANRAVMGRTASGLDLKPASFPDEIVVSGAAFMAVTNVLRAQRNPVRRVGNALAALIPRRAARSQ